MDDLYTRKELILLCNKLKEYIKSGTTNTDHKRYAYAINDFIWDCHHKDTLFRLFLSIKADYRKDDYWWADPLDIMMFQKPFDEIPMHINVPVYGVVARWRLEIGK